LVSILLKQEFLKRELGKALTNAYDKRLTGDYGVGFIITKEDARVLLETAQNFVQKTKSYLGEWLETAGET